MISSALFSLLLAASLVSAFNLREDVNDISQQKLFMAGMDKRDEGFYPRIINGRPAALYQFPYEVALVSKDRLICAGSLIANEWVLTAAQCTEEFNSLKVQLGMLNLTHPAVERDVGKSDIFRPDGNNFGVRADIALIKISHVEYTSAIQPIGLPQGFHHYFNTTAMASGWGYTTKKGRISFVLRYVTLNIISNSECQKSYNAIQIKSDNICTGHGYGGICFGDSGAPLLSTETRTVIGIASFGVKGACGKSLPYGYTRVDFFLKWIRDTTKVPL